MNTVYNFTTYQVRTPDGEWRNFLSADSVRWFLAVKLDEETANACRVTGNGWSGTGAEFAAAEVRYM